MSSLVAFVIGAIAITGQADRKPVIEDNSAKIDHCVVSIIDEAQVPAKEAGVLMVLDAQEGLEVKAGDELARLDDQDQAAARRLVEFEFQVAKEEADNDVNVRYAIAQRDVAEAEYEEGRAIQRANPGSIARQELRRLELTAQQAVLRIEVSKHEQTVAELTRDARSVQVDQAELNIQKRIIKAPQDGVVVQVFRHKGEWLAPGDPVFRIVRMDKLRVEGYLNSSKLAPHEVLGQPVVVNVQLARGLSARIESKIDYVSPLVEANGDYRVWTEIENKNENGYWLLRPGQRAKMEIQLKNPVDRT